VTIEIYTAGGKLVNTLTDREYSSGMHEVTWDGNNNNGKVSASGAYIYRVVAGRAQSSGLLILAH
jgi:flagellar hook assembly protein FlgD